MTSRAKGLFKMSLEKVFSVIPFPLLWYESRNCSGYLQLANQWNGHRYPHSWKTDIREGRWSFLDLHSKIVPVTQNQQILQRQSNIFEYLHANSGLVRLRNGGGHRSLDWFMVCSKVDCFLYSQDLSSKGRDTLPSISFEVFLPHPLDHVYVEGNFCIKGNINTVLKNRSPGVWFLVLSVRA